jgi:hypothetical protein
VLIGKRFSVTRSAFQLPPKYLIQSIDLGQFEEGEVFSKALLGVLIASKL